MDDAGQAAIAPEIFARYVDSAIERSGARRVLDVGGGANPLLPPDVVAARGLEYVVADASEVELAKCQRDDLTRVVADAQRLHTSGLHGFDLCFSRMLLEHLPDPDEALAACRRVLCPGGRAVHLYPTLFSLPFVVNRALPQGLSHRILSKIQPHRVTPGSRRGVFPSYYRHCLGPTQRQLLRLRAAGFEVEEFVAYYGHAYYERFPALEQVARRWWKLCASRQWALHTSYALVNLMAV